MTRARGTNGVPAEMEALYYSQRASAGLIITGGIYVSRMAIGGIGVAGIFTEEQLEAWRRLTKARSRLLRSSLLGPSSSLIQLPVADHPPPTRSYPYQELLTL